MIIKRRAILKEMIFKRVSWGTGDDVLCNRCKNTKDGEFCTLCNNVGRITNTLLDYFHWGCYIYERKR